MNLSHGKSFFVLFLPQAIFQPAVASGIVVELPVDKFLLLSTAIPLKVLEIRFNSGKAIWEGVTGKSKNWLDDVLKECKPTIYGENVMPWVENYVLENLRIWVKG